MTEIELQQVVDALAAKTAADAKAVADAAAAKRSDVVARVKAYVLTHAATLAIGAGAAFVVLKVL